MAVLPEDFTLAQAKSKVSNAKAEDSEILVLTDNERSQNKSNNSKVTENVVEAWNEDSDLNYKVKSLKEKYHEVSNTNQGLKPMLGDPYSI